jgi:hypothetical protein
MYTPRPHILTPNDITTINYTLSWPHLENPSNTTFAGRTQIDVCRCPRADLPQQLDQEPGHIYTRYKCVGPEVRIIPAGEALWVLEAPHGPINMLRPATKEERERRKSCHVEAEPGTYADHKFLLLTGPCPRGRYQAYATLHYLRSLNAASRQQVSCLHLLIQPYEEDCVERASRQSFAELADYILHHLPHFETLCLNIWDDETKLRDAASEFSILLHKDGVSINVGWNWMKGDCKEYNSAQVFLEAMTLGEAASAGRRLQHNDLEEGLMWKDVGTHQRGEAEKTAD